LEGLLSEKASFNSRGKSPERGGRNKGGDESLGCQKTNAINKLEGSMKQGDILVSSWGYEQTNVDFYEVVKVTAKTVTLVPIERKVQLKGFMRYEAMPIPGSGKGKAFRRRIIDCFDVPACRITSYAIARLWNGEAQEGSSYA
jgi:hypothetical protein